MFDKGRVTDFILIAPAGFTMKEPKGSVQGYRTLAVRNTAEDWNA